MQKISSYLYPNRVILLADLAAYPVEYTNVYQRIVKIYQGIDNVVEFDIKNADQKRIDLIPITSMQMNVMDASGNALPNSPYTVTPVAGTRGIATVTIPKEDLVGLDPQFLRYSVTGIKGGQEVIFYGDTRFDAVGKLELVGSAMPITRADRVYDSFTAEIDIKGMPIYHSSAIPAKFYEAVKTDKLNFEVHVKGFVGSIWLDATKNGTTNVEAWRVAGKPFGSWTQLAEDGMYTGTVSFSNIPIGEYQYFRLSYTLPMIVGVGAGFKVTRADNVYTVTVQAGGTGYSVGSMIKVVGSQLGGVDGVNDLIITVTDIDASSAGFTSSYVVSSVVGINWSGVAASGTGTHLVTGTNIAGTVDKVIVS